MVDYNYSEMGKKGSRIRWDKIHSKIIIKSKMSKEKVAIMAYISGDGYLGIRKNYFHYDINIALDSLFLARRVLKLFKKEFNVIPQIKKVDSSIKGGLGYYTVRISNKPICLHFLSIGKYSGLNWKIPSNINNGLISEWIKCYFDCEAYVNLYNKQIQVKSVNSLGLNEIRRKLQLFKINSKIYGPYKNGKNHNTYDMLIISGEDNLKRYQKLIGFYHPDKRKRLQSF